jgi:hypothetical protein
MTDIDTDIANYSVENILAIFNIVDPTVFNVTDVANSLIAKMKAEKNDDLVIFFGEARDKVLDYLQNLGKEPVENEITIGVETLWTSESTFRDKNPVNPSLYFDENDKMTISQKAVEQTTSGPPIIATQIIVVDSQFRSNILPYSNNPTSTAFNTNFTFNLSSNISKAIAIKLYSYQIPTTWNAFNAQAGNTFFLYNGTIVLIPDGNYTPQSLVAVINATAQQNSSTASLVVTYNENTQRVSFMNTNTLNDTVTVMFFIQSNTVNFSNCGTFILSNFQTLGVNATLGWLLGFRTPPNLETGNVELFLPPNQPVISDVAPDTYGPKYFTLSIEDYSNQRLSSGLFNITNTKQNKNLSSHDYYNTVDIACKLREGSLTQAQIYAINSVDAKNLNSNLYGFNNRSSGPTSSSTFAVIPLADVRKIRPDPYIKFGGDLFMYKRKYIKPTNLERFNVSLYDDKGNLVNLYDNDWSFSLVVEEQLN